MPRSNRSRRSRDRRDADEDYDVTRASFGGLTVETKHGRSFNVQSVSATSAVKEYVCPGCSLGIAPATPHVVAWRADGLFGAEDDLAARRHWHTHCWRIS
ncbi:MULTISPECIES: hypothetical protein [unclassified Frigoribacterium]|uniref:hypothetical protein n=1 Tax=unclassified Frigoribacterium TaxID=2627005 RepID=UPI001563EAEF|nr:MULTISPECIES: hypothetical protein [unclassified Frigoribacterium]NQW86374.1 hypothetical protein [Frigoribacterium sp. VKM Ac-2860]NQX07706.1 hypothetical protein [Frigoribacterium sp. VKM Ac-2859]